MALYHPWLLIKITSKCTFSGNIIIHYIKVWIVLSHACMLLNGFTGQMMDGTHAEACNPLPYLPSQQITPILSICNCNVTIPLIPAYCHSHWFIMPHWLHRSEMADSESLACPTQQTPYLHPLNCHWSVNEQATCQGWLTWAFKPPSQYNAGWKRLFQCIRTTVISSRLVDILNVTHTLPMMTVYTKGCSCTYPQQVCMPLQVPHQLCNCIKRHSAHQSMHDTRTINLPLSIDR